MNQTDVLSIAHQLQLLYPTMSVQELFGGIRLDYKRTWTYLTAMNTDALLASAHAFAARVGLHPRSLLKQQPGDPYRSNNQVR